MRKFKKFITLMTVCVMLLQLTSVAYAESDDQYPGIIIFPTNSFEPHILKEIGGQCGENITYSVSSSWELRLSGSGDMYNYTAQAAPWYEWASRITSITIDDGITFIGNYAFEDCVNMQSIYIPDTVTEIGYDAFNGCSSLVSIEIPENVTIIGSSAFLGCSKLQSITLPDKLTNIYGYTFAMCGSLSEITIGENVRSIDDGAFHNCRALSSVRYAGSAFDWSGIAIGRNNTYLINANIIFAEDSVPITTPGNTETESEQNAVDYDNDNENVNEGNNMGDPYDNGSDTDEDGLNEDDYTDDQTDDEYIEDEYYDENYEDEYSDDEYYEDEYEDEYSEEEYSGNEFQCSDWALDEVAEAYNSGLIPELMMYEDLTRVITREKFAAVSVYLYSGITGNELTGGYDITETPFTDCYFRESDYLEYIAAAYQLGLINGVSANEFDPDSPISRQDLSVMLGRVVKKYIYPNWSIARDSLYPFETSGAMPFADDNDISEYAKESVYFMAKHGIVKGIDSTHFAPQNVTEAQRAEGYATSTKEQAMLISLRCYNYLINI